MKNKKTTERKVTGSAEELKKIAIKHYMTPSFKIGLGYGIVWVAENYERISRTNEFAIDYVNEAIKDLKDYEKVNN